eukprot:403346415
MDKILDNLYLGDIQGASNLFMLKRLGITHILQVAAGFNPFFPGKHFTNCIEFIKNATSKGKVLVHCYAGISRSASVVIAFLMQEHSKSFFDAMSHVRKRRPIIFPNPGFQRQLMEFERTLKRNQTKKVGHENAQEIKENLKNETPQKQGINIGGLGNRSRDYLNNSENKNQAVLGQQDVLKAIYKMHQSPNKPTGILSHNNQQERSLTQDPMIRSSLQGQELKNQKQPLRIQSPSLQSLNQARSKSSYGQVRVNKKFDSNKNIAKKEDTLTGSYLSLQAKNTDQMYNSLTQQRINQNNQRLMSASLDKPLQSLAQNLLYQCNNCHSTLFTSQDVIEHSSQSNSQSLMQERNQSSKVLSKTPQMFGKSLNGANTTFSDMNQLRSSQGSFNMCPIIFIKRKEWINEQDGSSGQILCPKKTCSVKIGTYCLQGQKCQSCPFFQAPSYQIFKQRVSSNGVGDQNILKSDSTFRNYTQAQIPVYGSQLQQSNDLTLAKNKLKMLTPNPKSKVYQATMVFSNGPQLNQYPSSFIDDFRIQESNKNQSTSQHSSYLKKQQLQHRKQQKLLEDVMKQGNNNTQHARENSLVNLPQQNLANSYHINSQTNKHNFDKLNLMSIGYNSIQNTNQLQQQPKYPQLNLNQISKPQTSQVKMSTASQNNIQNVYQELSSAKKNGLKEELQQQNLKVFGMGQNNGSNNSKMNLKNNSSQIYQALMIQKQQLNNQISQQNYQISQQRGATTRRKQ